MFQNAAMCQWTVIVDESDISGYAGRIYGSDLADIIKCVKENEPQ
jgi:hypothetical protein